MELILIMDYLADLLKEKKQLALFPNFFPHLDRLLDEEIARVRFSVFRYDLYTDSLKLPEPKGGMVQLMEKVYIPKKDHPDYNFVGRILGPRGMTAKQLEQETGCKIMIRGKGSMRDRVKEELSRGKPNYEHLDDELHVLIQCEDTKDRAGIKISNAANQIRKLLVPPAAQGIDELKRKQLMELAIINGTYRPNQTKNRMLPGIPSLFSPTHSGRVGSGGSALPSSPFSSLFSTPLSSPSIAENSNNSMNPFSSSLGNMLNPIVKERAVPNIPSLFSPPPLSISGGGGVAPSSPLSSLFSTPLPSPSIVEGGSSGKINPLSSLLNNPLSPFYI